MAHPKGVSEDKRNLQDSEAAWAKQEQSDSTKKRQGRVLL